MCTLSENFVRVEDSAHFVTCKQVASMYLRELLFFAEGGKRSMRALLLCRRQTIYERELVFAKQANDLRDVFFCVEVGKLPTFFFLENSNSFVSLPRLLKCIRK